MKLSVQIVQSAGRLADQLADAQACAGGDDLPVLVCPGDAPGGGDLAVLDLADLRRLVGGEAFSETSV